MIAPTLQSILMINRMQSKYIGIPEHNIFIDFIEKYAIFIDFIHKYDVFID